MLYYCRNIPQKKDINFELCYVGTYIMLLFILQHTRKNQSWLGNISERQFSFMLHLLFFKMNPAILYVKLCAPQERIGILVSTREVNLKMADKNWRLIEFYRILKHENAHWDVTVDRWAYDDTAFLIQDDSRINIVKFGTLYR
jgi:hypothetical protein